VFYRCSKSIPLVARPLALKEEASAPAFLLGGRAPFSSRRLRVGSLAASGCILLPRSAGPNTSHLQETPGFSNSHSIRPEGEPSNHSNAVFLRIFGEPLRTP
jgi:hypothetical protein